MTDIPDAPWIGLDKEEYEARCNPYYGCEQRDDYESEQADLAWKILQEGRDD